MSLVLILSSHVAASAVGGSAQVVILARQGVDTVLAPTVLFGRHPGLGPPGGGAVSAEVFAGMLEGVEADGVLARVDAVITGYFASAAQVRATAEVLDRVNPAARIIVDPIMGDAPKGLYVPEDVAVAIARDLVPRAHLVAPNAWELSRLTGRDLSDPVGAARSLGRPVLVSSISLGDEIGVIFADADQAWLAAHPRQATAPNGTGDRLTALFTAGLLQGQNPSKTLLTATQSIASNLAPGAVVRLQSLTR